MGKHIEKHIYTEYTEVMATGTVTVQVPEEEDMPIQLIIDREGRPRTIFELSEFQGICTAIVDCLQESGRPLEGISLG